MASAVMGGGGGGVGGGGGGAANVEAQLVALLDKLEGLRQDSAPPSRPPMIAEVRTLELWRAVIAECLATVFYVFLVCGAYSPWTGKTLTPEGQLTISLVAGMAMAVLVHSFGQVRNQVLWPRWFVQDVDVCSCRSLVYHFPLLFAIFYIHFS